MAEAKENAVKKEAKEQLVELVSNARKPQIFNIKGEEAIHLHPRSKSRPIKEEQVNFEIEAALKRGDILVNKL